MTNHEVSVGMTRRRFLGTAAAGVMASALRPGRAFGQEGVKARKQKLNIAAIGVGGIMETDLRHLADLGQQIVALCDVDERRIPLGRSWVKAAAARGYKDYRKLLEREKDVDAVIIATPDHWHAPIIRAAMQAGKHIYCEKPLGRSLAEVRQIRELTRKSNAVTQTGNQGSASRNLRRNIELIQAGIIGAVRDVYIWHPQHGWPSGVDRPAGQDPVPAGFDWDFWIGPAPLRPYKDGLYHPFMWRGWYDFGSGSVGDFCCHAFNLPVRALELDYPTKIEVSGTGLGKESFAKTCTLRYHFPPRGRQGPVKLHFYSGGLLPPPEVTEALTSTFGSVGGTGCVLVGEQGLISAGLWNTEGYLRLKGEAKFAGIFGHPAAKAVPTRFRSVASHMSEWVDACLGGPATFSNFDLGGHLTELGLAGALALRVGHDLAWDGERLQAGNAPEAQALIHPTARAGWDG